MSSYVVKHGQNIYDCMLCISGDIQEIDLLLELNNITSYTPNLEVGQVLNTTDIKKSNNEALLRAEKYPFANESIDINTLQSNISEIWDSLDEINNSTEYLSSSDNIPLRDNSNNLLYSKNG